MTFIKSYSRVPLQRHLQFPQFTGPVVLTQPDKKLPSDYLHFSIVYSRGDGRREGMGGGGREHRGDKW